MNELRGITILVALLVAGEAAVLAIRMHIFQRSKHPWISLKNDLLLALDVVVGLALILLVIDAHNFPQEPWYLLFVSIGLLTHIYRVWEYIVGREISFCGNRSLFIVNNIKFVGLLLILIWGFMIQ